MRTKVIYSENMITETAWDFSNEAEFKPKEVSLLSDKDLKNFRGIIPDIEEIVAKDTTRKSAALEGTLRTNLTVQIFLPAFRKSMNQREVIKENVRYQDN